MITEYTWGYRVVLTEPPYPSVQVIILYTEAHPLTLREYGRVRSFIVRIQRFHTICQYPL